jgi:hypothetical protein
MNGFDDLYNTSQGCNEIYQADDSGSQDLNFNCPSTVTTTADNESVDDTGENPVNDVALQEPPLGGTNGLAQLEGQTVVSNGAPVNFTTTVRNPLATDPIGLNFVNYATDAISWFHFTKVGGTATPSGSVKTLSTTQLAEIFDPTAFGSSGITNWDQVAGGKSAPICVYVTNTGSGLYSLWQSYLGLTKLNAYVNSLTTLSGCGGAGNYANTHTIEQNEDQQIVANSDEANAIFFFSYGRYEQECKTGLKVCGSTGTPFAPASSTTALGEVGGVKLTAANISIDGDWPTKVYLSNVYSDGSGAIPVASQATLNYVSEFGFLCNPQTSGGNDIIDPATGIWYHTEIQDLITGEYFQPIPLDPEGIVQTPAVLNAPYNQAGQTSGGAAGSTNPSGYCRVASTDGN